MEETGDRPGWMSAESLLRADDRGEFTDIEIVAGHEAGHALMASVLSTWPNVA